MVCEIEHSGAVARLEPLPGGKIRIRVELPGAASAWAKKSCETDYPEGLIRLILEVKGPSALCDEIIRDDPDSYVNFCLARSILAYRGEEDFGGKTVLDFGCGSAASTMALARILPRARLVGVELNPDFIKIAEARARHRKLERARFLQSPSGVDLPAEIGAADFIVMNAVYEHLLPEERRRLLPRLWAALRPGGLLFINETPNRAYHRELHTTGLPLINYLPDRLAHALARRGSYRFNDYSWPALLREGIRGGTQREILRLLQAGLPAGEPPPRVIEPSRLGLRDRIDLQFSLYNGGQFLTPRQRLRKSALKALRAATGIVYGPSLMLAIEKPAAGRVTPPAGDTARDTSP